ncbi:MAG: vWA domain-containing protein [Thermodesulfobacteriota bacterium]
MVNLILKFAAFCRASDLKVSTSEVLDCLRHLSLVDFIEESQFKTALKTNFVKSRRDQPHFDRLYALFFHQLRLEEPETHPETSGPGPREELLAALGETAERDPLTDAVVDFLKGDPIAFMELLRRIQTREQESSRAVKSNLGVLSGRLEVMLKLNQMRGRIMQLIEGRGEGPEGSGQPGKLRDYFHRRLETAFSMITDEKKPRNDGLHQVKADDLSGPGIGEKFFSSLTRKEVEDMREVIAQLVRRMKDMVTRRWAKKSRGILDVKKTLRRAGRFQGVPIEVVYKKRPPRKGKIVTLCDVSGSVWAAARFMLNMIYSLQDCFSQVRSFVFVAELAEITKIFEKFDVNEAIEKVMTEAGINYQALTDYGEMLSRFHRDHMHVLNKKTTFIIVGDGRSNYFSPREHILDEIREKCRRVIWLNPESERFWSDGDSEMHTYTAYCHEVRPCQNLKQLTAFIEELIL